MFNISLNNNPNYLNIETSEQVVFDRIIQAYNIKNKVNAMLKRKFEKDPQNPAFAKFKFLKPFDNPITNGGRFDVGMLGNIMETLSKISPVTYKKLQMEKGVAARYMPTIKGAVPFDDYRDEFTLRYYQKDIIERCYAQGRGIVVLGTGGGKSLVQASLIDGYNVKNPDFRCILIVPNRGLLTQIYNDFEEYGVRFTFERWGDDYQPKWDCNVVIATHDILEHHYDKSPWVNTVDLVLCDECHKIAPKTQIYDIVSSIPTVNRFGMTGSMNPDQMLIWRAIGLFGPVLYKKNTKSLRDEGFLTEATVFAIALKHKGRSGDFENYQKECEFISTDPARNEFISSMVKTIKGNLLILVNYIDHGECLKAILTREHPDKKVYFISGETKVSEREAVKKIMEERDDIVCVAMSSIFAEGINIKNLPNILLAMGGKAYIRMVQSIGRGLRLHKNKKKLYIFDIYDLLKYSLRHYTCREGIYEDESIKVLSPSGTTEI